MTRVEVDWVKVSDLQTFFDLVFEQTGAPEWHGRNLNALGDSWVTGSICSGGPPFEFVLSGEGALEGELGEFASAVRELAEDSVRVNGGVMIG